MTYQLIEAGAEDFDRFAALADHGTVHSRLPFLETLGADRFRRYLLMHDGRPVLGTLQPLNEAGAAQTGFHLFSAYQGLLTAPEISRLPVHSRYRELLEATTALLGQLEAVTDRMAFRFHPHVDDLRAWQWFHYHEPERGQFSLQPRYTGLIDLGSHATFDDYLAGIRASKRRQYRLAQKAGLSTEASSDVDTLVRLYRMTFERQGIATATDEVFWVRRIAEQAIARGFGELRLTRTRSGEPASATLFLHDERGGFYLYGANDPAFRGTYSGIFAFAEALRCCHSRGLRHVDVGGINSPARGDFKVAFNAAPKAYFEARWSRSA